MDLLARVRLRRRRDRDQRGITVAELAVSMMIFTLIGGLAVGGLSSSSRSIGQVDDEVQGLADLRIVSERLSRDLRQARGIDGSVVDPDGAGPLSAVALSNANQVTIWIDVNSDYKQSATETITWKLVAGPNEGLYDVVRQDKTGTKSIVGHSLVSDIAFSYDSPPPKTRIVTVDMTYDAMPGRYAKLRTTRFESRLRNVP